MFKDRVTFSVEAGKGGNGVIAWRREKYIPKGGPAGGNGGKGGSIIFIVDTQLSSLEPFRNTKFIKAQNGQPGGSNQKQGKNGEDLILKVPCGTLVKNFQTQEVLCDLTKEGQQWMVCRGGKGGKGNTHFKSPTNRAPHVCTSGEPGQHLSVELELKLIADVGLVGFPNAGKSTLFNAMTDVAVKIAPYPFTTLRPQLGFFGASDYGQKVLLADIPGIIGNAHKNRGLGLEFLRHIERTSLLVFVLDASGIDGRSPREDFKVLKNELKSHNPTLLKKSSLIVLNKIDLEESVELIKDFRRYFRGDPNTIFEVSALAGEGLANLEETLKLKVSK